MPDENGNITIPGVMEAYGWNDPTEQRMHLLEARLEEAEAAVREVRMARDLAEAEIARLEERQVPEGWKVEGTRHPLGAWIDGPRLVKER